MRLGDESVSGKSAREGAGLRLTTGSGLDLCLNPPLHLTERGSCFGPDSFDSASVNAMAHCNINGTAHDNVHSTSTVNVGTTRTE